MDAVRKRRSRSRRMYRALCFVYGERCLKCSATANLHIDHVVPFSLGGPDEFENYQLLCGFCNLSKGTMTADYRLFVFREGEAVSNSGISKTHPDIVSARQQVRYYKGQVNYLYGRLADLKREVERLQICLGEAQERRMTASIPLPPRQDVQRQDDPCKAWWQVLWPFKLSSVTA